MPNGGSRNATKDYVKGPSESVDEEDHGQDPAAATRKNLSLSALRQAGRSGGLVACGLVAGEAVCLRMRSESLLSSGELRVGELVLSRRKREAPKFSRLPVLAR